jgi:hypothetical protein
MPSSTEAEEHLRVIRSLMEKATIYRAVSAPTALAAGIAALVVASRPVQQLFFDQLGMGATSFRIRWIVALLLTLAVNARLIIREAKRRGDPLISAGMRAAFCALLPPFICGGFFLLILGPRDASAFLAIFYGLGLLATGHFAPRSIVWLGWSFLVAGLLAFLAGLTVFPSSYRADYLGFATEDLMMLVTFGGFHFIYAACTWPRKAPVVAAGAS